MNKLFLKLIIWHAAVLGLALMFWGYGSQLSGSVISATSFDALAVIYLVLLLTAVSLGIALFQKRGWALTLTGIVGLIYLFQFGFTALNLLGVGIVLLLGLYSASNSKTEISQRNKINIKRIIHHGAGPVAMGLFLLISFAAYQAPSIQKLKDANRLPTPVETFIRTVVENTVGTQVQATTPAEKQHIITQITRETFTRINSFFKPYFKYAPPAVAFGLFLVLWGFSSIFTWLSAFLAMPVFWVLKKTGIVSIQEHEAKAEALVV